MSERVMAKVFVGHDDSLDYHAWYFTGKSIRLDRLGRPNPRMMFADAYKIECNNTECPAWGFVREDAITALLDQVQS